MCFDTHSSRQWCTAISLCTQLTPTLHHRHARTHKCRERERERERDRDRDKDRQTDRQRQTDTETDTEIEIDRQKENNETSAQGLKWVGTPFPGPPFLQSGVPRPQRALFSHGNARLQAGKIVLSIETQGPGPVFIPHVYGSLWR